MFNLSTQMLGGPTTGSGLSVQIVGFEFLEKLFSDPKVKVVQIIEYNQEYRFVVVMTYSLTVMDADGEVFVESFESSYADMRDRKEAAPEEFE